MEGDALLKKKKDERREREFDGCDVERQRECKRVNKSGIYICIVIHNGGSIENRPMKAESDNGYVICGKSS